MAIVEGEGAVDGLIGPKILPDFAINRRTAHIIKATLQDTLGLRIIAADKFIRHPGTKFERAVAKFGDDTLTVTLRGVEIVVPNEVELDYAGYLAVESFFVAKFGRETSALTKEFMRANAIFSTTNFGSATNSTVAYTAANASTNSFFADVIASIRRVKAKGEVPDTVVMSGPVYERIRQSTNVLSYVRGIYGAGLLEVTETVIRDALASFGIKNVLVGDSYYNTAADGATPSLTQIWSNTYIWVGKAGKTSGSTEQDGVGVPTIAGAGVLTYWEGFNKGVPSTDLSTDTFAGGNYVESYPDISIDSMVVRLKMSSSPYIGNSRVGDLISTQYS